MTSQALPAWNVVRVRWPVSAAWRAISAVVRSRISPMAMTSGSCRSRAFRPDLEGQPGRRVDLRLGDARDDRLDRVLERGQAALAPRPRRQLAEAGIDRRRLAAAGRAGEDDRAGGLVEEARERLAHLGGQAQVVEPEESARPGEEPDHGLLAVERREGAEPHLHLAGHAADPALLGDVGAIGQQLGQDLEPGDDVGRDPCRQDGHRLEHAVDPPADLQPVGPRVEVDVAHRGRPGRGEQLLDGLGRITAGWRGRASRAPGTGQGDRTWREPRKRN